MQFYLLGIFQNVDLKHEDVMLLDHLNSNYANIVFKCVI